MPKLRCQCEVIINYGEIPCKDEWLMISDTSFDRYDGFVNAEGLYDDLLHALKCPNCGRLHIFWDGFQNLPQTYKPDLL